MPPDPDREDRKHDQLWSEINRQRDRMHTLGNVVAEVQVQVERCEKNSDKLHAQEVAMAGMQRDVATVARSVDEVTKKIEAIPGKVFGIVAAAVPLAFMLIQGLWWLFQQIGKK